jgi:glycosyltransferase involved in cell wall biosynthesis
MTYEARDLSIFKEVHRVYLPTSVSMFNTVCALLTKTPLQVAYYRSRAFKRRLHELLPTIDGIIAHLVRTSDYVKRVQGVPKVLEMTDAISLTYRRFHEHRQRLSVKTLAYALEYKRLRQYERAIASQFDMVSLISPVDRDYLVDTGTSEQGIDIFTNGVNLAELPFLGPGEQRDVIFIGNMRTIPNIDACRFMATKVLPLICAETNVRFRIIGEIPEVIAREFQEYEAVDVVGRVDSIAEAAKGAFAAVCPMRFGAGVQNKVLEYMALGIPCVTTGLGLEGIAAEPQKEVIIADSAEEIATAVLKLLGDPHLSTALSVAARGFIEREHTWPPIQKAYRDRLAQLMRP